MLNLCITCDHELFFGDNYFSENEVVIEPTYKLCEVLEKHGVRATFFTDVCSIFKYKSLSMTDYPTAMEKQLRELLLRGHDVQLHLHPHWYKSEYLNGKWQFDKKSYRLHSFGFENADENNASMIVRDGKNYLLDLLKPVNINYKCIAYRAGGLCLQPERELLMALKTNGIHIDSSVIKGVFANTDAQFYSYLRTPKSVNWWMNPETGVETAANPDIEQNIFEVPIGSLSSPVLSRVLARINRKLFQVDEPSRGSYMPISVLNSKPEGFFEKWWYMVNSTLPLSFDRFCASVLIKILNDYLQTNDCSKNEYFLAILCHPKILRNAHLKQIDSFIDTVYKQFKQVRFSTMQDVYNFVTSD